MQIKPVLLVPTLLTVFSIFAYGQGTIRQNGNIKTQAKQQTAKAQSIKAKSIMSKLVGTWMLVESKEVRSNGELIDDPQGHDLFGLIIYDRTGRMAVQISSRERPTFPASGDLNQVPPEQLKTAFQTYYGYFGTFTINDDGSITHHIEGALFPNEVGSFKRYVEFSGDKLVIKTPPEPYLGQQRIFRSVWQRAK